MFEFLLLFLSALLAVSASQPLCDPFTQYENSGQCCQMCGPGTKMLSNNCKHPRCESCGENEFQDTYTTKDKCSPQPYCDPNKNFEAPVPQSKQKIICSCNQGFHCSSEYCITCVPHKTCGPGEGVLYVGNQTQDTVCQKCAEGTFSNETSMIEPCVKHKICSLGFTVGVAGTDRSDTECESNKRLHIIVGTVVALFIAALIVGWVLHRHSKRSLKNGEKMVNVCVECIGPTRETVKYDPREETMRPMMERTPVETEDSSIPSVFSEEHGRSENGKVVCPVVEEGKAACLPRQESQISASSTTSYS
ncbi:tumor necrosis factor receptor superfamily member 5 isoform X2 [Girardinichthys multiradiatus]|uniref:tumor necrosis factor receptor superfamily member 5 isoform X2 n=1 Tax=Girardinichthys multiradiatus TaxID=208333 RepID=UPI001FAD4981|nr:tumor necrosis factor receptor superfamily member 5 isoform X2 [Girardinichthys multiradiatus]